MRRTKRNLILTMAATLAVASGVPARSAEGQSVLKKIREQASKRVEEHKAKVDSAVVKTATGAVDSTLDKTTRGADAVVNKVGSVADTAITRTERGVRNTLTKSGGADELAAQYAAQLASGHLVLREIKFVPNSDQLDPSSGDAVAQLAKALAGAAGVFLIEGHTDAMPAAAAAQALSQQRAAAVKAQLVTAGVPAERLLSVGYGATRPASDGKGGNARIELTKAQ